MIKSQSISSESVAEVSQSREEAHIRMTFIRSTVGFKCVQIFDSINSVHFSKVLILMGAELPKGLTLSQETGDFCLNEI